MAQWLWDTGSPETLKRWSIMAGNIRKQMQAVYLPRPLDQQQLCLHHHDVPSKDAEKSQEKACSSSVNTLKPKKGYTTALHRGNNQSWGQLSSRYTYSLGSATVIQANMRRDSLRVAFLTAHKKRKQSKLTFPETPPALADYSPLSSCFQSFDDDFGHLPRFFNWLLTAEQTIQ